MMRGLDAWLTREPWDPITEPHAPWVPVWLGRDGSHDFEVEARCNRCHRSMKHPPKGQVASGACECGGLIENKPGSWGVEHGGDTDGETTMVVGSHEDAVEACRRMNARYEYVRERDSDPESGICRVCGDLHEYPETVKKPDGYDKLVLGQWEGS